MTVAELIEKLKDSPQDWTVFVEPEHPNAAGLPAEDQVVGKVTSAGTSGCCNADGNGGVLYLPVYTGFGDCITKEGRFAEAGDPFLADRHADVDAGEFGGWMTDADYYDRISGSGTAPDATAGDD